MPNILGYLQIGLIIALSAFVLMLLADNAELSKSLDECGNNLSNANANLVLTQSSIDYQNSRLREAENQSVQMQQQGALAEAEAELTIEGLEQRIAELRRAPKATSCDAIRVKLLRNVGVHL